MKTFEHFVTRVFTGTDNMNDTYLALDGMANDGRWDDIIDHFKDAAHQWRDQFTEKINPEDLLMNYPIEDFLEVTNSRSNEKAPM